VSDRVDQQQAAIDEFLALLHHEQRGDTWAGRTPDWYGPVVFGGVGLALTISAACGDAPVGSRLHSVHAHFLRPVKGGQEIVFRSDVVKAGRTFNLHHVTASQDGKPVITMTCSFTTDTDGYVYDLSGIPDGVPLHTALLGYATDWTGVGGRPLHLEGDTTGMISLDHTAWFHRPARADDWLLQDVQSLVNAGGRGTLRGVIRNPQGLIVASMAQEMLLQPVTP
jgi:acyl-CoA thioesterase-2